MIIIYPAQNWNSFVTVAEAETIMTMQFPNEASKFVLLSNAEKEALCFNSGTWIRTCPAIKYPSPLPQDFMLAQVAIMVQYMGIDNFMQHDPSQRAITKEKVGSLEVDYDPKYKEDQYDIHPLVYRYLSQYGCSQNKGFSHSGTVKD